MRNVNKAFTLTELLIALGVIGILCAILLPVIFNLMPNQNTMMAKRAYYIVQSVIADIINDEACYPDKSNATNKRLGFDDGYGYSNCTLWGGNENTGTIETEGDASLKFAKIFVDKLDTNGTNIKTGGGTFTTKDGMSWKLTDSGFNSKNTSSAKATLIVDVNGADAPNCGQSATGNVDLGDSATLEDSDKCAARTSGFDRFVMNIYEDGKISVSDGWAQSAIKINKDVTE